VPKDDKVEDEDGEDVKHGGEETAPGKEKPEEVEGSKSEVRKGRFLTVKKKKRHTVEVISSGVRRTHRRSSCNTSEKKWKRKVYQEGRTGVLKERLGSFDRIVIPERQQHNVTILQTQFCIHHIKLTSRL
jgi:hypothetical protein